MTSAAANNPQSLVGVTLAGVYRLDRLLNEGRHGALFDGRHVRTGVRYAVRLIRADTSRRNTLVEHLKKVAAVMHPQLVVPHEVQVLPDDQLVIATPFLPGQDLNQRIASRGKLSSAEGQLMMRQLASALYALQQAGTAHGNLTATNIFFCRHDDLAVDSPFSDGKGTHRAVLIDAGLAILDGNTPTSADDQRALGRMMNAFVSDLQPGVRQVLERTQEANPDSRYRSIADLWRFFDEASSNKAGQPGKSAVRAVATTVVPQLKFDPNAGSKQRRGYVLGGAAALGLVLVAGVAILGMRKPAVTPVPDPTISAPAVDPTTKRDGPESAAGKEGDKPDAAAKDAAGKDGDKVADPSPTPDPASEPKAGKGKKKKGKKSR
jgi:serine/threonine protein kinase